MAVRILNTTQLWAILIHFREEIPEFEDWCWQVPGPGVSKWAEAALSGLTRGLFAPLPLLPALRQQQAPVCF